MHDHVMFMVNIINNRHGIKDFRIKSAQFRQNSKLGWLVAALRRGAKLSTAVDSPGILIFPKFLPLEFNLMFISKFPPTECKLLNVYFSPTAIHL